MPCGAAVHGMDLDSESGRRGEGGLVSVGPNQVWRSPCRMGGCPGVCGYACRRRLGRGVRWPGTSYLMTVDRSRQSAPRRKGSCPAVLRSPAPTRSESGHRRQDPGSSLSPGKTRTTLAAAGRAPAPDCSRCHRRMGWCAHWHPLRRPRTSSTPPEVSRDYSFQSIGLTSLCAESNHPTLLTACVPPPSLTSVDTLALLPPSLGHRPRASLESRLPRARQGRAACLGYGARVAAENRG